MFDEFQMFNVAPFVRHEEVRDMIDERDIEGRLVRETQERGGLCLKLDSSGKKGIQDRLVLLPGARIFFVELKKPDGRISVLQKVRRTQVMRMGFPARVIRSPDELDKFIGEMDNVEKKE